MYRYTCPTCKNVTEVARRDDAAYRPFCCDRCKMIDLGRWFNEEYRVSDPLTGAADDDSVDGEEFTGQSGADHRTPDRAGDGS